MSHSAKIRQWCTSFDTLLAKDYSDEKPPSDAEQRAIAILQVYRRHLETNVAKYAYGQGDPGFWDRFTAEFGNMVDNAAIAVGLGSDRPEKTSRSLFHMDIGVSSVLFSIIARCRDPTIRRKAIRTMLARGPRKASGIRIWLPKVRLGWCNSRRIGVGGRSGAVKTSLRKRECGQSVCTLRVAKGQPRWFMGLIGASGRERCHVRK